MSKIIRKFRYLIAIVLVGLIYALISGGIRLAGYRLLLFVQYPHTNVYFFLTWFSLSVMLFLRF